MEVHFLDTFSNVQDFFHVHACTVSLGFGILTRSSVVLGLLPQHKNDCMSEDILCLSTTAANPEDSDLPTRIFCG